MSTAMVVPLIESDPTAEQIIRDLLLRPDVLKLLTDKGVSVVPGAFIHNVLLPLVRQQLMRQDGTTFDQAAFDASYDEFEEYLRSAEDKYLYFAPLGNFRMEPATEKIGPFIIRRLNQEEYLAYSGFSNPSAFMTSRPPYTYEFAVEVVGTVPRGASPLTQTIQDQFWWLVAAMKLLRSGSVGYHMIWTRPLTWSGMSFGSGPAYPRHLVVGRQYVLSEQDAAELRELWAKLSHLVGAPPRFWMQALHRFLDGVDRVRPDEALVDYWIACESLFGEDIEVGELSYRLSLRIAHFLGGNGTERETIRNTARRAYKERGRLLHGSTKLNTQELVNQSAAMEDLTRRALHNCILNRLDSRDKLIVDIEKSIVHGI
jgi:hypothetical protein